MVGTVRSVGGPPKPMSSEGGPQLGVRSSIRARPFVGEIIMSQQRRRTLYAVTVLVWAVYLTAQMAEMGMDGIPQGHGIGTEIARTFAMVLAFASIVVAVMRPLIASSASFYIAGANAAARPRCKCETEASTGAKS